MNDAKPRRIAREAGRSEAASSDAAAPETGPTETGLITVAPEAPAASELAPETVTISEPVATAIPAAVEQAVAPDDAWAALADTQAAFVRGLEQVAAEMTGITRSGFTAASDAAIALLGARTFAEAVEINAGLAQRGVDAMIEGSARLSEIGVKAVAEASRPLLSQLGGAWSGVAAG